MKPERWVFGGLGLFYLVVTPIYWFTAHEVAGTWVLGLSGAMALMVFFYVQVVAKKINPRPSDEKDAEVDQWDSSRRRASGPSGVLLSWQSCASVRSSGGGSRCSVWASASGLLRVGHSSTTAGTTSTDRVSPTM